MGGPPYHLVRAGVDMIATHGGVRVNHRPQTLDSARAPVPGLFVAGVDMGGVDADVYNMTMNGLRRQLRPYGRRKRGRRG